MRSSANSAFGASATTSRTCGATCARSWVSIDTCACDHGRRQPRTCACRLSGFEQEGFEIAALFDAANEKIGHESRSGVPIYDIRELKRIARKERLDIAVIAVPAPHAQPVVEQVIAAGIKAILNFSPGALKVPGDVKLKSVDLTVSLESLSFYLAQGEASGS